jgi:hypothetical protein
MWSYCVWVKCLCGSPGNIKTWHYRKIRWFCPYSGSHRQTGDPGITAKADPVWLPNRTLHAGNLMAYWSAKKRRKPLQTFYLGLQSKWYPALFPSPLFRRNRSLTENIQKMFAKFSIPIWPGMDINPSSLLDGVWVIPNSPMGLSAWVLPPERDRNYNRKHHRYECRNSGGKHAVELYSSAVRQHTPACSACVHLRRSAWSPVKHNGVLHLSAAILPCKCNLKSRTEAGNLTWWLKSKSQFQLSTLKSRSLGK